MTPRQTVLVVLAVVAGLAAASGIGALSAWYVSERLEREDAPRGSSTPINASQAEWAFVVRSVARSPTAPNLGGTVFAFLTRLQGDANETARNGSVPVELAAVSWDARNLTPPASGTILQALNLKFAADPPVVIARGALSKNGDAVEMTIPRNESIGGVVVNAPQSSDFLFVHWPTGTPWRWTGAGGWAEVKTTSPALLARTPGA